MRDRRRNPASSCLHELPASGAHLIRASSPDGKFTVCSWPVFMICLVQFILLTIPLVERLVDLRNLRSPPPPVPMFHIQQSLVRPMEVVGDVGYLLVKPIEGVAYDSPGGSGSTSNACWQLGQCIAILRDGVPFRRL